MNRLKRNEGDTKISREKWLKSGSQDPKWELWTRIFNLQEWAFINAKSFLTPPHINSNFCLKHIKIELTELKWLDSFHNSNSCNLSSLYYIVYLLSLRLHWNSYGFWRGKGEGSFNARKIARDSKMKYVSWITSLHSNKQSNFSKYRDIINFIIFLANLDICRYFSVKIKQYQEKQYYFPDTILSYSLVSTFPIQQILLHQMLNI